MGASGLGNLLVKEGLLTQKDRLILNKTTGFSSWAFAKGIIALGLLDQDELAAFLAERTTYELAHKDIIGQAEPDAMAQIDIHLIAKLEVFPISVNYTTMTVAMVDPLDKATVRQLEFFTDLHIKPLISTFKHIYRALRAVIPNFEPPKADLDSFLINHAATALHRIKVKQIKAPAGAESAAEIAAGAAVVSNNNDDEIPLDAFDGDDGEVEVLDTDFDDDVEDFDLGGDDLLSAEDLGIDTGGGDSAAESVLEDVEVEDDDSDDDQEDLSVSMDDDSGDDAIESAVEDTEESDEPELDDLSLDDGSDDTDDGDADSAAEELDDLSLDDGNDASGDDEAESAAEELDDLSLDDGNDASGDDEAESAAEELDDLSLDDGNDASGDDEAESAAEELDDLSLDDGNDDSGDDEAESAAEELDDLSLDDGNDASGDDEAESAAEELDDLSLDDGNDASGDDEAESAAEELDDLSLDDGSDDAGDGEADPASEELDDLSLDDGSDDSGDDDAESAAEELDDLSLGLDMGSDSVEVESMPQLDDELEFEPPEASDELDPQAPAAVSDTHMSPKGHELISCLADINSLIIRLSMATTWDSCQKTLAQYLPAIAPAGALATLLPDGLSLITAWQDHKPLLDLNLDALPGLLSNPAMAESGALDPEDIQNPFGEAVHTALSYTRLSLAEGEDLVLLLSLDEQQGLGQHDLVQSSLKTALRAVKKSWEKKGGGLAREESQKEQETGK